MENVERNDNAIDMKQVQKEIKRRKRKEWIEDKKRRVKAWIVENQETLKVVTPIVVSGLVAVGKHSMKARKVAKEEERLYCRHWDPREGEYYWSTRPLKAGEKIELQELYASGLSKGEALRRLGLLKH